MDIGRAKVKFNNLLEEFMLPDNDDLILYRIIPLEYFFQLLYSKELWVSQVLLWEDVYENFLAKANMRIGNNLVSNRGIIPCFYGQCWTVKEESDAMWRIYSHDKKSVRIKSSLKKIVKAALNEVNFKAFSTDQIMIGKVDYLNDLEIEKWVYNLGFDILNGESLMDSLFLKRNEFKHEEEVRLVIRKVVNREEEERGIVHKHLKLNIEPNDFIEEVTFDPRINEEVFLALKEAISKMEFTNKINKSTLYNFKPLNIDL